MSELGPAMSALNERQRDFVLHLFQNGGKQTDAARKAGYVGKSVPVTASQMMRNDKIRAAIREVAEQQPVTLLPLAHKMMSDIARNPASPDHFKAVKHMQAIAGISPTTKTEIVHIHKGTAELKAELLAAMELLQSVAPPLLP